jgi:hypothetical protein
MTQAIRSASCECQCRQVKLRAREYDDGAIGVEELAATYSHSDVDCESRSATSIATPFDRDFPAINSDCTAADAVEITVVSAPSGKSYHWGWLIESEGDAPQTILEPGALNLQLENTGPFVVVVGLFSSDSPGDDGSELEPVCSDEYDYPEWINLTRPSTLDFSAFDASGEYCSIIPPGRNTLDVYDRLGNSPIKLRCHTRGGGAAGGGIFFLAGADIARIGANYEYRQGGRLCAAVTLFSGWAPAAWFSETDYSRNEFRAYLGAQLFQYMLDEDSTLLPGYPDRMIFIAAKWLSSTRYTYADLYNETRNFHSLSGDDCSGAYWTCIENPLKVESAQTFLEYLGDSAPSYLLNGGFYADELVACAISNSGCPSECEQGVISSVGTALYGLDYGQSSNVSWSFEIASTTAGANSSSDCECIDESWDSALATNIPTTANSYVGDGQTVSSEACDLSCTVASRTIEVFPKRIRLTLPSVIDLTQMRVTDCLALGNLSTSAISNAYMERHASLDDQYVLDAECSDVISDPWSGSPASPAVHIPWDLNESLTLANCEAFSARYRLGGTNLCPNEYFVKLYVGYVDSTGPSDSANTVRLFTQALVAVRFVNNGGTAQSPLYQWWSLRLGPEFDLDDYTTTEQQSYTLYDNVWNWQHDWDFQNFGLASWAFRTSNYGGIGCPSPPSPPNAWYCAFYSHNPNFWLASKAAKQGISTDMSDYDPNCTGDPYFLLWMKDMNNVLADFRIVPENSYEAASEPSCSSSEFIRYQASGA